MGQIGARRGKLRGFWTWISRMFFAPAEPRFAVEYDPRIDNISAGTIYRLMRPNRRQAA